MATLQKRNKRYYIVFSKRIDGKLYQKKFSLGTESKRTATKKKFEYEDLYREGNIDPFNGWNPNDYERSQSIQATQSTLVTLKELTKEFLARRSQANKKTKDNYKRILKQLQAKIGETLPVTMITEMDIRQMCFRTDLSNASQANYLRHLKVFFGWLKDNGFVQNDVTQSIKKPKVQQRVSEKVISETQLQMVFQAYRKDILTKKKNRLINTYAQSRVWFRPLVSVGFYAGLRRKEIIELRWSHIDFGAKQLTVTNTKSGKERTIPLQEELYIILKAWDKFQGNPKKGLVFPSPKSMNKPIKMTGRNVTRVFKKYVKEAGLSDSINFHGLRHSCATNLLRMGFDINEVGKIMGHSSLEVTKIYEHLTASDLSDKMDRLESQKNESSKSKEELKQEVQALKAEIKELRKDSKP